MAHKIIGMAYSDSDNLSYIKNQLIAIKNFFPAMETELSNENNELIQRHIHPQYRNRLPLYVILKDGAYMTHRHGKWTNNEVIQWLQSIPALNV
tara:strand:+ start:997 stop:1278 length:282 start_codon:yes stop_codon:yes gene_type:complete